MKNVNKIRQLLKDAIDYKSDYAYVYIIKNVKKALALLPCETCNGTGKVSSSIPHTCIGQSVPCGICDNLLDPCPDCQPKTEIKEKQE